MNEVDISLCVMLVPAILAACIPLLLVLIVLAVKRKAEPRKGK